MLLGFCAEGTGGLDALELVIAAQGRQDASRQSLQAPHYEH